MTDEDHDNIRKLSALVSCRDELNVQINELISVMFIRKEAEDKKESGC